MTMLYTYEFVGESGWTDRWASRLTDVALCDDCAEYHEEYPEWGSLVYTEALPEWRCDGVTLAHGRACVNA